MSTDAFPAVASRALTHANSPAAARSLWMQDALGREPGSGGPPLSGSHTADVCVVGGGLTGLWAALRLAELDRSLSITVLEADICGSGASGANGGFAMTWWPKVATLKKIMSTDDALRMARDSEHAVAAMGEFCRQHRIDADFMPSGWLWAATNASQVDSWKATLDDLAALGAYPFKELSPDQVTALSGSSQHVGGVFESGVATVQPAALVRGLRSAAIAAGVRVSEHSPMTGYDAGPAAITVRTPAGTVKTQRLVLATNAWLARFREIRRHLLVLGSDVVATAPMPGLLETSGWLPGLAISDSRRLVHYYRTTGDGRVVFGKGGGRLGFCGRFDRDAWATSARTADVSAQLARTYPWIAAANVTHSWAGPIDYSCDSLPFFGRLGGDPRVVYGVGFSGNGVGPSYLGGRILASLSLGLDDEWANSPMIRTPATSLPPEPVRYLGGRLVRAALIRKEADEDREARPSRIAARLAKLDPTSFVG
jgi:glycine/D-amino acid oxidase-like deaminating enzyme